MLVKSSGEIRQNHGQELNSGHIGDYDFFVFVVIVALNQKLNTNYCICSRDSPSRTPFTSPHSIQLTPTCDVTDPRLYIVYLLSLCSNLGALHCMSKEPCRLEHQSDGHFDSLGK